MPIRFRCTHCTRLLGIATRKAGAETTCPHCGAAITVPVPSEGDAKTERVNVDDLDQVLGNFATERVSEPGTQVLEPPRADPPKPAPARAVPPPLPKTAGPNPGATRPRPAPAADPNDPPLFEGDLDDLFGKAEPVAAADRPKPPAASGRDALSLGEPPRVIVLGAQTATLLMCGVVVLLALAFAAGYFLAR